MCPPPPPPPPYFPYAAKLTREAFEAVLKDDSFKLPTSFASDALKAATKIVASCENVVPAVFVKFSDTLDRSLRQCIPRAQGTLSKVQRQNMWSNYHCLISSKQFQESWRMFLKGMGTASSPSVYQFVTMQLMDALIKHQLPLPAGPGIHGFTPELTTVEENALRYVAGYVVRHTKEKIESSGHTMRDTLLHALGELCSSHDAQDCENIDESEQWVNSVDRGGLVHVSSDTFMLFHSLEMELRQHFSKQRTVDMEDGFCTLVKQSIVEDVDVQFYMGRVAEDLDIEEKAELLSMIVDIYVVVRGFSFSQSLLESYKQMHKKALQKSRGLRKTLHVCVSKKD